MPRPKIENRVLWFVVLVILWNPIIAFGTEYRDKIGLVLSGGGAKGAAHIGVLSVLEENRIPVDVITGTSMGAYVGGMYAMGFSAEEIKNKTLNADWQSGYEDRASRNDIILRRKKQNDDFQIYTDIGLSLDGEFKSWPGAFLGHGMAVILRNLTENLPVMNSFDDLAIPYRAVATDITSVEPVLIDKGNLAKAMQASMTVPGALKPIKWNNRLLVDGGVVNNMPVDAAQQLGADKIIAIDLRDSLLQEEDLNDALNIVSQLTTYMTNKSVDQQKALMDVDDIYLAPDVSFMIAPDFDKMDQAYEAGRKVAIEALPELLKLQLSLDEYEEYQKRKYDRRSQLNVSSAYYIDRIEIDNHTNRSNTALIALLDIKVGRVISNDELEDAINRLNAQDIFARITYQVEQLNDETVLIVDVTEKSWGPGYLNFKLSFEDDFANRSEFAFGAQYIYTNLTDKGGEWQFDWLLGSWKRINTQVYLPLDYKQTYYSAFGLGWNRENREFNLSDEQRQQIGQSDLSEINVEYQQLKGFVEFGWNIEPWSSVSVGYNVITGDAQEVDVENETQDYTAHGPYFSFVYDDLDNFYFPVEGFLLEGSVGLGFNRSKLGNNPSIQGETVYFDSLMIMPFNHDRHTLVTTFKFGGSDSDELVPIYVQDLGGLFNLSGFHRYELNGRYQMLGSLIYRYRWLDNDFGAFSAPVYLGGSLERGGIWNDNSDINWDSSIGSASVYVAIDSLFGPVYLAYGQSDSGESSVYLSLGSHFN